MSNRLWLSILKNLDTASPIISDDTSKSWVKKEKFIELIQVWKTKLTQPRCLLFHFIPNTIEGVAQFLGAIEAGHVIALLDPELPKDSRSTLINTYLPEIIIDENGVVTEFPNDATNLHPDLFLLLSTSGSTGSPKFVRLSYENISSNAKAIADALNITPPQVGCAHLPLHYSYGLSMLTSHLIMGAPLHLTQRNFLNPQFWPQLKKWNIAHLPGVPFHYQMLQRLRFERLDLPHLKVMTQAGGNLDIKIRKLAHEFMSSIGGKFHVMYGQTEASPRITTLSHEDFDTNPDSVGPALDGGRIEVLDKEGNVVPTGNEGDIVYFGTNVMMGYASKREDLLLGDINQGRLATNDIGKLDEEGCLTITGRGNRVGKVAGLRVNLDEVEKLLINTFDEIAVSQNGENLYIYHNPLNNSDEICEQALNLLLTHFTLPKVSYRFKEIDKLPRTVRGKIDYAALN